MIRIFWKLYTCVHCSCVRIKTYLTQYKYLYENEFLGKYCIKHIKIITFIVHILILCNIECVILNKIKYLYKYFNHANGIKPK